MEKALQTFEGLIRRSIAPSVTFFVVFVVGELIAVEVGGDSALAWLAVWLGVLGETFGESSGFFGALAILVVLGVGYGLSAAQQILFDNRLKRNFDPGPHSRWLRRFLGLRLVSWCRQGTATHGRRSIWSEGRALRSLRRKVVARLRSEPRLEHFRSLGDWNDYLLYEILGGIDPTDTRRFVDTAKSIGIVFSSAIAVTAWNLVVHRQALGAWAFVLVGLLVVFYWLGREATLTQYRARALRLYVNFLMMPAERLERRLLYPDEESISPEGAEAE